MADNLTNFMCRLSVNPGSVHCMGCWMGPRTGLEEWVKTRLHRGEWQSEIATHHFTEHNTLIHNILSTALQLSISQKAPGTLPEDGNLMPKHVGVTIHIKLND
jgi:hypothetical protein